MSSWQKAGFSYVLKQKEEKKRQNWINYFYKIKLN